MRYFLFFISFFFGVSLFAQEGPRPPRKEKDSTQLERRDRPTSAAADEKEEIEISIKDYKIISHARDTTFLDTTLTIQKEYKYNYLRKDLFELMPFANIGQPYNKLGVDFERTNMFPQIGAKGRHYNYFETEDITYYNVPTPVSDLFFKTTLEQGQLLDALLTFNTSPRLNFSIAYKGFRSLGKYQYNQAQSGNFRTTFNYETKNRRYSLRGHVVAQDIEAEENGGINSKVEQFESGNTEFSDRKRIDILFADVSNKILGKRYYWDHQYKLVRKTKDSSRTEKTSLALGHVFNYETRYYQFDDAVQNEYFGSAFLEAISDRARLKTMNNEFNVKFSNATLGMLEGSLSLYNYNYYFNSKLITEDQVIQNQLKGEEVILGAKYRNQIGGFKLNAEVKYTLSGQLTNNIMKATAQYQLNENNKIKATVHASARMPDFNFLLYQSEYANYNWQNTEVFENEKINGIQLDLESTFFGNLSIDYSTVDNYSYFGVDQNEIEEGFEQSAIKPFQENNVLNHTKVKYSKEFRLGGFALNNTVMYQNVSQANQVLNLPQLVTRNTLYFSSNVFKKAMYLQTGITLKYFTAYTMDSYNPVLGEFYIQNNEKLGDFPMLDFFINARVQQTRIYLKAEHFNSSFGETNKFYAAPNYPYRDFVIRFGVVWNFFS
ncbi:putative porin [Aurantibacter crassamenti]|uniref:putative porin n=1 Tax=Aurantibacter crassamenti TaxID=1837375 RepID=UPI00193AD4B4|nr:putative porin [Aurantibacter crassamenti]MBM1105711.1 putative porin [Aurantibacter crassamenti]